MIFTTVFFTFIHIEFFTMNTFYQLLYCICLFLLFGTQVYAQTRQLDSLTKLYNYPPHDTVKVLVLLEIAGIYSKTKIDSALQLSHKSLLLAEKIKFLRGEAAAWNRLGSLYWQKGEYDNTLHAYKKAINIWEKTKNLRGLARNLGNVGAVYYVQGNYPKALDYNQKSLEIQEKLQDKIGIATNLSNIGNIYNDQNNLDLALEYYQKALAIREKIGDALAKAKIYNNIGAIYYQKDQLETALQYYRKTLQVREENKDKQGTAVVLNNIGMVYDRKGHDSAAIYFVKSLEISRELKDKRSICYALTSLASIFSRAGKYPQSIQYAEEALQIAKTIGSPKEIEKAYFTLYLSHKTQGNTNDALNNFELYKALHDSIFTHENSKMIANLEAKALLDKKEQEIKLLEKDHRLQEIENENQATLLAYTQKQAEADRLRAMAMQTESKRKADSLFLLAQKAQLEADNLRIQEEKIKAENKAQELAIAKAQEEKELHQTINYLVIVLLGLAVLIAVLIYRSRQRTKLTNVVLKTQRHEIQEQKTKLEGAFKLLSQQSNRIQDSIRYAERIQQVILPTDTEIKEYFSDAFVVFRPKDVVSGDFYWFSEEENQLFLAALDCTGHGVPGAFMSMIGYTLLNEIIHHKGIYDTATILETLHQNVVITLKQTASNDNNGMDVCLCKIVENENHEKTLYFSGAKRPLCRVRQGEMQQFAGTRRYIGGRTGTEKKFETQVIDLQKNDVIFLFSDGYADQNNVQRESFGSKRLFSLFKENAGLSCKTQKVILETALIDYMQQVEQRDDITIIGVKI